ncbi:MAG: hypothetical protein ACOCW2_01935 [Chitinivibrionales bacterium]
MYRRDVHKTFGLIIAIVLLAVHAEETVELAPRSKFNIPLVQLKLAMDDRDKEVEHVRISIDGYEEYALITYLNDTHVHYKKKQIEKTVYAESPDRAYMLTDFEAQQLSRVVRSFIQTLNIFNKDLKKERWGRCLYLDSFFPRFLKSFYFLVCAARNSPDAFPAIGRIPESKYDVSLRSEKSDRRIRKWREQDEHIIKLRIITKELIYQLKKWDKKELQNKKRNKSIIYSNKVEKAFDLFIRIYFNVKPPTDIPDDGKHL